ncbi:MAG: carboxypeptidase regulatory-like domain-containing protein [Anaerolineales bacterium]|nr:carboxypeptidase regulatory-like domain-containing protein [Anaerolineales bacterium]
MKPDRWRRGLRWVMLAAVALAAAQGAPARAAAADQTGVLAALYQVFFPLVAGGAPEGTVPAPTPEAPAATDAPAPTEPEPAAAPTSAPTAQPPLLAAATYPAYLPIIWGKPYPPPTDNFFGVVGSAIDGLTGPGFPGLLDSNAMLRNKSMDWLQQTGMEYFRTYGSDSRVYSWRYTNPANNTYDWSVWDLLMQSAQQHGISVLASIGNGTPQWANGSSDWREKPTDLWNEPMNNTAWYKYVYNFVERYDGDGFSDMPGLQRPLKYVEFWNEPDLRQGWLCDPVYNPCPPYMPAPHQFDGSVDDYVRLSAVGYSAAKAANPNVVIVGPATAQTAGNDLTVGGGPPLVPYFIWSWTQWEAAGGLNYVDRVSFTRYPDQPDWDAQNYVNYFLDIAANHRGGKPVWLTETGWSGSSTDSNQTKASNFARFTFEAWSYPFVERFFWYSYHEPQYGPQTNNFPANDSAAKAFITTTYDQSPYTAVGVEPDPYFHPIYRAAEVLLDVFSPFNGNDHPANISPNGQVRVYRFDRDGQTYWAAWLEATSGSQNVSIDTNGRTTRKISLFGDDLGTFGGGDIVLGPWPIYLTTNLTWNQNIGRITGRVHTSAVSWGNGVSGVTVQASGPGGTVYAATDADGNYSFTGLQEGSYTVTVLGYTPTPANRVVTVDREARWGRTSFVVNP